MLWNILVVIGVMFIINGITMTKHTKALETLRENIGKNADIYSGTQKGLLFMTSTDVMLDIGSNGVIKKAFGIKSGWLRKTMSEELPLNGVRISNLLSHKDELSTAEHKACRMAARQYEIRNRKK